MLRPPPRTTRTDPPFPYTTLFRSAGRLSVQTHATVRIDPLRAGGQQVVDVRLFDAIAAHVALDRDDVADQRAAGEADPHILYIGARDAFRLLHGFPDGEFGPLHVRDEAAPHAPAFALARAQDRQFAIFGATRDQRGHLPRSDVDRGDELIEDRKST